MPASLVCVHPDRSVAGECSAAEIASGPHRHIQDTNIARLPVLASAQHARSEYVLSISITVTSYYGFTETQISTFQARRQALPTPLPPYVGALDQQHDDLLIVGFLGQALAGARKLDARCAASATSPRSDDAVARHRAGNLDDAIESRARAIAIDRKFGPAQYLRQRLPHRAGARRTSRHGADADHAPLRRLPAARRDLRARRTSAPTTWSATRRCWASCASRPKAPRCVTSVCTGSLVLGAAGLLEGYRATTHWSAIDFLAAFGAIPTKTRVCVDRNRFTGGGVTAGIDFALTLVSSLSIARPRKRSSSGSNTTRLRRSMPARRIPRRPRSSP